jgi:hypothetical protein
MDIIPGDRANRENVGAMMAGLNPKHVLSEAEVSDIRHRNELPD